MVRRLRVGSEPAPVEVAMRVRGVWDVDRAQAALNIFGGAAFAVGSLLFLNSALVQLGIAFFVAGSFGMLAGAVVVWNERYAPRGRPGSAPPDAVLALEPVASEFVTEFVPEPLSEPLTAAVTAPVPAAVTSAVTSPAEPGSRPATPPGD